MPKCGALFDSIAPLVTTLPCITEVMYFLGRGAGWRLQEELWEYFDDGLLTLHDISAVELSRVRQFMAKYADTPMDFADALLVAAAAETLNLRTIFTLDHHFRIYRTATGDAFDIVP